MLQNFLELRVEETIEEEDLRNLWFQQDKEFCSPFSEFL